MKNIIVTGGLGYIGSHFISSLDPKQYNVICIDNLSNSSLKVLQCLKKIFKNIDFYSLNLLNYEELKKTIADYHSIDSIVHFAALKYVDESIIEPNKYYCENINSTINIIKVADTFKIKKIIFSSSAAVYGEHKNQPVSEDYNTHPVSPYAFSKLVCERIISDFCRISENTKGIALRYFNPIGAHPSSLIGEFCSNKATNIMQNILKAFHGQQNFFIFGNDYSTEDGTSLRDYIHVMDLVEAHKIFLELLDDSKINFDFYNVGTGKPTSTLELINIFNKVNKTKIEYKFLERRPGDIDISFSDNSKISRQTNWTPKYTVFDMCFHAFEWTKKNQK